jgi:hypothetical protein
VNCFKEFFSGGEVRGDKKIPPENQGDIYMDGLVSTGNKFPSTILVSFFPNQKIFSMFFINILFFRVEKQLPDWID